jgi:predicted DNA-binding transcriptional regulator YafY
MRNRSFRDVCDPRRVLETSTRLLRLLSLLQARPTWTGRELAERLEVTTRTVRNDVERLRRLGYPVHATPGTAGGYRLGAGSRLPPLLLDDDEAVAVAVGLRTAAGRGVAGIEESSVRALAKLGQVLPERLRRRVGALQAYTVPFDSWGPTVDPTTLTTIAGACRDLERLRFGYRSPDGTTARRLVEPHRLVHTGRRWYLAAWDCEREDWRTFRVDRIEPGPTTDRRFEPRELPHGDAAKYVARAISSQRDRYQATVILHAPLDAVAHRVPHAVGTLEAIDDRSCLLRTGADWLGGLAVYVADIGVEFTVLEPPEFAARVRQLAEQFARAAASPTGDLTDIAPPAGS